MTDAKTHLRDTLERVELLNDQDKQLLNDALRRRFALAEYEELMQRLALKERA